MGPLELGGHRPLPASLGVAAARMSRALGGNQLLAMSERGEADQIWDFSVDRGYLAVRAVVLVLVITQL